jgi:hypothetical protein
MIDDLPTKTHIKECGIINLDKKSNDGSHWVAYIKNKNHVVYFDSFGNLKPPPQLVNYFYRNGVKYISYNYDKFQKYNSYNCGHLCLKFLYENTL